MGHVIYEQPNLDVYGGSIFGKLKRLRESGYCWSYINDPKSLARKIVDNSRNLQVDFVQSFYNMSESEWVSSMKTVPPIRTSVTVKLQFERFQLPTYRAEYFEVPCPASHVKRKYVPVRLVANYR